jgi:hypothetical protein
MHENLDKNDKKWRASSGIWGFFALFCALLQVTACHAKERYPELFDEAEDKLGERSESSHGARGKARFSHELALSVAVEGT